MVLSIDRMRGSISRQAIIPINSHLPQRAVLQLLLSMSERAAGCGIACRGREQRRKRGGRARCCRVEKIARGADAAWISKIYIPYCTTEIIAWKIISETTGRHTYIFEVAVGAFNDGGQEDMHSISTPRDSARSRITVTHVRAANGSRRVATWHRVCER